MTNPKKNPKKSEGGIFSIFGFITESIAWLQIVASPLLIGLIIGSLIYFPNPSRARLVLGSTIAVLGLVIGIIWATKQWKGKGTVWFISRVSATPELDNKDENQRSEKSIDESETGKI